MPNTHSGLVDKAVLREQIEALLRKDDEEVWPSGAEGSGPTPARRTWQP